MFRGASLGRKKREGDNHADNCGNRLAQVGLLFLRQIQGKSFRKHSTERHEDGEDNQERTEGIMMGNKEFKTKSAAGRYAHGVYKNYGFDASVFEVTNRKTGKRKYAVINPRTLGMKRI